VFSWGPYANAWGLFILNLFSLENSDLKRHPLKVDGKNEDALVKVI
jgi:hypothetical protein